MESIPFIDLKKQYQYLKNDIDTFLLKAVNDGQYINGPEVSQLEKALAEYTGVSEVIACANGTDALTLPLLAWDIKPGDAVFCPSFTFIATAEVVALRGAQPIFVDIDPETFNICSKDLQIKITKVKKEGRLRPRVVIPVDLFGLPADYAALEAIAKENELFILEDAAQGFGGRFGGKQAGSFGLVGSTSFFPAKPLGCYGDGGAMFTNQSDLAAVLRSLRGHGTGSHKYEHVRVGLNSRLDTLQAAILLCKLKAFPLELAARQKVAAGYNERLAGQVITPKIPAGYLSSYAQYTIRVPREKRDKIMSILKENKIPSMIYYPKCLHLQPAFSGYGGRPGDCPEAEKASQEVLSLPMHPYLEEKTLDLITQVLIKSLA